MRRDQPDLLFGEEFAASRKSDRLSKTGRPRTGFPVAEGVGIFVGIVAWDLLADGRLEILKAILIAAPCSLVWFAIRRLRQKYLNKKR